MKRLVLLAALLFAPALRSSAAQQYAGELSGIDGIAMYTTGEPFTLVRTCVVTRTLADGAVRTTRTEEHVFRDSAGHLRLEVGVLREGTFHPTQITLIDPVALTSTVFSPGYNVAQQGKLARPRTHTAADDRRLAEQRERSAAYLAAHPGSGSEQDLGARAIAGVAVAGFRKVTVYPALGDRPSYIQSRETWTAPELGMVLEETTSGPLLPGSPEIVTTVTAVSSLQRAEPDPALFQPPPGLTTEQSPTPPIVLTIKDPEYSEEGRRKKISGNVLVALTVGTDGVPRDLHVKRGLGYGLDAKAVESVQGYRFRPATRNGTPVATTINISVNFQIF